MKTINIKGSAKKIAILKRYISGFCKVHNLSMIDLIEEKEVIEEISKKSYHKQNKNKK